MNSKVAQLLASAIVDEWPLPAWVIDRMTKHPDVARAVEKASELEDRLRHPAGSGWHNDWSEAVRPATTERRHPHGVSLVLMATAATVLLAVLWRHQFQAPPVR
ncbi:MAG: hypothetical protein AAF989_09935, partial [Planctomycetota bacterium]